MSSCCETEIMHTIPQSKWVRKIGLGIYSPVAARVLADMLFCVKRERRLSNSYSTIAAQCLLNLSVGLMPNGEVVVGFCETGNSIVVAYQSLDDATILKYLASSFRNLAHVYAPSNENWWHGHAPHVDKYTMYDIEFSVKEVHFIYDTLLKRANRDKHFDVEFVEKMKGTPKDPVVSQAIIALQEEIDKLDANFKVHCYAIRDEYEAAIKDLDKRRCKKIDDAKHEHEQALAKLNTQIASMLDM